MESQMTHAHAHGQTHEQEQPHIVGYHNECEDEHNHDKKSVLEKVKAKAKKIKDTLKKHDHGHGNNHDHDHIPDDRDLDEEDEEEEEMVEDPEIHGAPIYEAEAIRSIGVVDSGVKTERSTPMEVDSRMSNVKTDESDVIGREGSKGQQRFNLGLTTLQGGEVPGAAQNTSVYHTTPGTHHNPKSCPDHDPTRNFVYSEEERPGQSKANLQRPKGLEEDPDAPKDTPGAYNPANYQTKVTDFTGKGGEEAEVTPLVDSLDKMSIYDELKPKGKELNLPTGIEKFYSRESTEGHDQFSPELSPPNRMTMDDHMNSYDDSKPKSVQKQNLSAGNEDFNTNATTGRHDQLSPELSAPKAKGMTTEDDKMNIYDEQNPKSGQEQNLPTGTEDFYTSVPAGSHDQYCPEFFPPKIVNIEDHPNENTNDRPSNQSTYTAKISSATSVIADKAISAKNVVASKLGYGQKDSTREGEMHEGDRSGMPASAVDYGKKIAATMTQKLNPVYEKVAGAGATVVSKMQGTGTTEGDKGVSVKDYFVEKLRPGEEDRALSEVISETLHKRKAEQDKTGASRPVSEAISDALCQRKGESGETDRPMGKVTESEEVARRLGTTKNDSSNEGNGMDSSSVNSPGKVVVEKIKGAVGSWFGKGEESHQSLGSTIGSAIEETGQHSGVAEERRLQESGN